MVKNKTKSNKYWKTLSQKGAKEKEIKNGLDSLRSEYYNKLITHNIFKGNSNDFCEPFVKKINKTLNSFFEQFDIFNEKEIMNKKKQFVSELKDHIFLIKDKRALCKIDFSSYIFYQFLSPLSKIIKEAKFIIRRNGILLKCVDQSGITLIKLVIKNDSYCFFRSGEVSFNLEKLAELLKCHSKDKSSTKLVFGENKVFIKISSKKLKSVINRTQSVLKYDMEDVSMEKLDIIKYPCHFTLTKDQFKYIIRNSKLYSNTIHITSNNKQVVFKEHNQKGKGEIVWNNEDLPELTLNYGIIDETKSKEFTKTKKKLKCSSSHPIGFLSTLKKMLKVIDTKDLIRFQIRNGFPIKIQIFFNKLGDTEITYFIAPRDEN